MARKIIMIDYELTIPSEEFEEIRVKNKLFEIKRNDEYFQVGHLLLLKEQSETGLTGRTLSVEVTYVTNYGQKKGFVVFGFKMRKKPAKKDMELVGKEKEPVRKKRKKAQSSVRKGQDFRKFLNRKRTDKNRDRDSIKD